MMAFAAKVIALEELVTLLPAKVVFPCYRFRDDTKFKKSLIDWHRYLDNYLSSWLSEDKYRSAETALSIRIKQARFCQLTAYWLSTSSELKIVMAYCFHVAVMRSIVVKEP